MKCVFRNYVFITIKMSPAVLEMIISEVWLHIKALAMLNARIQVCLPWKIGVIHFSLNQIQDPAWKWNTLAVILSKEAEFEWVEVGYEWNLIPSPHRDNNHCWYLWANKPRVELKTSVHKSGSETSLPLAFGLVKRFIFFFAQVEVENFLLLQKNYYYFFSSSCM